MIRILGNLTRAITLVTGLSLSVGGSVWAAELPAFPDTGAWYNVSRPLTWDDLKGRAVLLDFFTPGCINCVHMVPVEEKLAKRFGERLAIIGMDSPKFTNSGTVPGLKDFIAVHNIRHPVVLDAHMQYWSAWQVFAWPTFILIGPDGKPRGRLIGEQSLAELAGPIEAALEHAPPVDSLKPLPLKPLAESGGPLASPGGIAVTGDRVAIADTGHNRVVLATLDGEVTAVIGTGCAGGRDGGYAKAEFSRPHGLTFHDGKLYVADTRGQRIRVIDLHAKQVSTLAGSGDRAYVSTGSFPAANASLNSPWDVQWAGDKLYVSMAGNHQVWRYDSATGRIGPWAGSGREGLRDGDLHVAEFAQPSGLDVDAGTLYVADPESSALRAISLADGQVKTLIGQGLFKFGLRDGQAGAALLQHNEGLAWLDGSVYIADTFNDALRRLDLKEGRVSTVAQGLAHPQALAVLSPTTLLVAESGGNRIDAVNLISGEVAKWPLTSLKPADCPTE